jgi:hypothetical protein
MVDATAVEKMAALKAMFPKLCISEFKFVPTMHPSPSKAKAALSYVNDVYD